MDNIQTISAGSFFFQLFICAIFIAIILTSIDQNLQHINYDVVINFFCLFLQILLNFVTCKYAQSVTSRSLEVVQIVYDSLWYRLPCNQQKMIAFIIKRAQKPFYFRGYRIFTCSLDTFLTVYPYIHFQVYSYFQKKKIQCDEFCFLVDPNIIFILFNY